MNFKNEEEKRKWTIEQIKEQDKIFEDFKKDNTPRDYKYLTDKYSTFLIDFLIKYSFLTIVYNEEERINFQKTILEKSLEILDSVKGIARFNASNIVNFIESNLIKENFINGEYYEPNFKKWEEYKERYGV